MTQRYRFASNLPSDVVVWIKPDKVGFQLMCQPSSNDFAWQTVRPPVGERPTSRKFIDPNIINEDAGLPPMYAIFDHNDYSGVIAWIEKHFKNVEYTKSTPSDVLFTGEFKGYDNGQENKLQEKTTAETVS